MKKKILSLLLLVCLAFFTKAQILDTFSVTVQSTGNKYLSIVNKTAYSETGAKSNKQAIHLALIASNNSGSKKLEWYNMSGKDEKTPKELVGTATLINAISFDKEQFDKCKTTQDLKRMTGHITNNSFSHFASISDDIEKGIVYHCFIIQLENGKRGLLWLDASGNNSFTVMLKIEN